jgi:hypothetical protein
MSTSPPQFSLHHEQVICIDFRQSGFSTTSCYHEFKTVYLLPFTTITISSITSHQRMASLDSSSLPIFWPALHHVETLCNIAFGTIGWHNAQYQWSLLCVPRSLWSVATYTINVMSGKFTMSALL